MTQREKGTRLSHINTSKEQRAMLEFQYERVYKIENFNFQYPNSNSSISIEGSFNINHGDIVLLQGHSGSGKSTLLLALKGIIPQLIHGRLTGNILFHNQEISQLIDTRQIGYLGQNPHSQLICDNVFQELAFGLENQGLAPTIIHQKIKQLSQQFKIGHLLDRKVKTLSGGEKQKINLLSILIMEPEVLLLDEPTAFLDPENAAEIINIIKEYHSQKNITDIIQNYSYARCIIIIEHNIHYLKDIVNRVICINNQGHITEHNISEINFSPQLLLQPCKFAHMQNDNTTAPLLQINNLKFAYPESAVAWNKNTCESRYLLDNLQLTINPGQIIGIIGKNGSGKSTLLKLISKILPSKNNIYYEQQDIYTIKTSNYWKNISLLWQNPENHFLYHSVSREADNASLTWFELEKYANQNPFCLSEGQKRRLSLAISLKHSAALFLLDEPTFGQDMENKQKLAILINKLVLNKKSFIIVSHDIPFLTTLCNHIYTLDQGRLIRGK